jgi:ABC-2 type transport system permease protein
MLKDYLRILWKSFKVSFLTTWEYKIDFYSTIIMQLLYFVIQFVFLGIIFGHINSLKGWTYGDILFLILLNDLGLTLYEVTGIHGIFYTVITGFLNTKLVKPRNTFFLLAVEELNMPQIFFAICDIVLLIFVVFYFGLSIGILQFVIGIILFIVALPLLIFPIMYINTLSFFIGETEGIIGVYTSMVWSMKEYPLSIFNKFFIILFSILSPGIFLFLFLPSAILLGKISISWGIWGILLSLALDFIGAYIFSKFFKFGLKRYEGFG